jgi:DNA-binding response OmpR family regulator
VLILEAAFYSGGFQMKKNILIIEDDPEIAGLESDYLESGGYAAQVESSGEAGVSAALSREFDMIILDVMLPDKDGFEVCREIRRIRQTPVLFVTARQDDIDKIKGFNAGADDYMIKPFSFAELVARVGARISRYEKLTRSDARPAELAIRDLRINLSSRRVFLGGREIAMPNKEFELLSFLAKNPDMVFSKDSLLNNVWGGDAYIEPNTVTVHINRLRDKIETDASNPAYIKTVWGVGYKLIP